MTVKSNPETPTLSLEPQIDLNLGEAGAYVLAWSLDARDTALALGTAWHGLELQLQPGRWGMLVKGALTPDGRAHVELDLPPDASLAGVPFHVQAWTRTGLFGPVRDSFSNLASASF